ncbi:hypothetical protein OPV22_012451 [Ensete ventricosum]|uniref:Uncharacterized protein n=1 Tax=Ensete ventricosum TaxID=4639 RepID=A0AAV8R375_ENSVE|nr:hypothetical protein OPV22_012451 [Ensete ventricosum]
MGGTVAGPFLSATEGRPWRRDPHIEPQILQSYETYGNQHPPKVSQLEVLAPSLPSFFPSSAGFFGSPSFPSLPHFLSLSVDAHRPLSSFLAHHKVLLWCISTMSLACLVCHSMDSPSRSFRSYSVSSSEDEGQCAAVVSCLTRKVTIAATGRANAISTSKVTPFPMMASGQGMGETPRLLRSRALLYILLHPLCFYYFYGQQHQERLPLYGVLSSRVIQAPETMNDRAAVIMEIGKLI